MFAEDPGGFAPGELLVVEVEARGEMGCSFSSIGVVVGGNCTFVFAGDFVVGWREFVVGVDA